MSCCCGNATDCCPNGLPTTLYLTATSSTCSCISVGDVWTLTYSATGGCQLGGARWQGSLEKCGTGTSHELLACIECNDAPGTCNPGVSGPGCLFLSLDCHPDGYGDCAEVDIAYASGTPDCEPLDVRFSVVLTDVDPDCVCCDDGDFGGTVAFTLSA